MVLDLKSLIKVAAACCILFGLCTLGPAPINGKARGLTPHTDLKGNDEKTLQSEQIPAFKAQVGEVSGGRHDQDVAVQATAADGANVLAAGTKRASLAGDSEQASQVLKAASARLQPQSNHAWLWIAVALACVGGGIFGAKRWADNNIPNAPTVVPKRQGW